MHKSTLLFHFKILNESQFEDFRNFLSSDYFNAGPLRGDVIALFDHILSVYPDLNHDALHRENAHAAIFPGKEFLKGRLDKVMHEMNKILKEYILLSKYRSEENEFYRDMEWVKLIRTTGDPVKYQLAIDKVKTRLEELEHLSIEKLRIGYLIENEIHEWESENYSGKDDANLVKTIEHFSTYQTAQELYYINNLLFASKASQIDLPETLKNRVAELSTPQKKFNNPLLESLQKTTQLLVLESPSENDFLDYMEFLKEIENHLSHETLKGFYTYLRNFCTLVDHNIRKNLKLVIHEIHKECLVRGFFYYEGKILPNTFLTITRVALHAKNIAWLSDFIYSHKGRIVGESVGEEYFKTNLSIFFFGQGKYTESLDMLPTSMTKNVNYQILIKLIEIKCYFELKSELVIFKLEAFKVFLSRNTNKILSREQQQTCTKFVSILNQILHCRKGETKKINKIILKMNTEGKPQEETWLLEKINDLK